MQCEKSGSSLLRMKQNAPPMPSPKSWTVDLKRASCAQPSARQLNTHLVAPPTAARFTLSNSASRSTLSRLRAALSESWIRSVCATTAGRWCRGECVRCPSISLRGLRASHPGSTHATSSCSHSARCTGMPARVLSSPHPALGHSIFANGQLPWCAASARRSVMISQCVHATLTLSHFALCASTSLRSGESSQLGHFTGADSHSAACAGTSFRSGEAAQPSLGHATGS
mmetsp:Transcript_9548/g.23300  ORF Transcript_9548/g.23300 Transcript_9548/m.23300 type:complete len:228 (+) Transcript_9548:328-1011(+)